MCGIFGIGYFHDRPLNAMKATAARRVAENLLRESQVRGSNAAGIFSMTKSGASMFKNGVKATDLIKDPKYQKVIDDTIHDGSNFTCLIGHTRAQTKGEYKYNCNNHPITSGRIIGVHNGNISNDDNLFETLDLGDRHGRVDSEVIFSIINYYRNQGKSIVLSVKSAHKHMYGSYACAFVDIHNPRYLNIFREGKYSPVVMYRYSASGFVVFASTENILRKATETVDAGCLHHEHAKEKMEIEDSGVRVDLMKNGASFKYDLKIGSASYMT